MITVRGKNSSPYKKFATEKWESKKVIIKLGSRDEQKTHGSKTEDLLRKTLPTFGFIEGQDFKIDQLDGTSKSLKSPDFSLNRR